MKNLSKIALIALGATALSSCGISGPATKKPGAESITILPVNNIPEDFMMGVDISSLKSVENSGAKFYDANGKICDPLKLLKAGGADTVRIRVWNDPKNSSGKYYGGGNNDVETAVELAARAKKEGFKILIDFHYSDFWADPNKQTVPKAWQNLSYTEKETALREFTKESLSKFKKAGAVPQAVQIGNEINNGMAGEYTRQNVNGLLKAGSETVREFDSSIKIVIHYTDPLSEGYLEGKCKELEKDGVDYDILATSYYPYWHGDVSKLGMTLRKITNLYGKKTMVAEVSYPWTDEEGDGFGNVVSYSSPNNVYNYPFSVEGQAIAVRDVIAEVAKAKGTGVFYWEPAWIPARHVDWSKDNAQSVFDENKKTWEISGSGWASYAAREYDKEVTSNVNGGTWDNQAFFDFDGTVLDSVNVFKYSREGSKGPLRTVRIENPSVDFAYGKAGKLPETVKVTYNDGQIKDEKVEWNSAEAEPVLSKPDFGEYKVSGTVPNGETTTCTVKVTASNYLANGGFESGDLTGWTVENPAGKGNPKIDKNNQNAKEGLAYFTAWESDEYEFNVFQKAESLPEGKYICYGSFQGTGVSNPSGTYFYAIIRNKDGSERKISCDVTIANVWKNFFKAELPEITVTKDTESITVGAFIKCKFDGKSGNGAWIVMDDVNLLMK